MGTPATPMTTGVTEPPVTVTVAVPVQVRPDKGEVESIWPGDRDRVDAVGQVERRARADRDDGVRNAVHDSWPCSGLASGSRSGTATPLTTTVVGLMSVTGMKLGVVVVEPKTKICKLAGVVALMLKGPNGVPTPIWVVIGLPVGIGTVIRPPSTIWAPPALGRVAS